MESQFLKLKQILDAFKQSVSPEARQQIEQTFKKVAGKFMAGDIKGALEVATRGLDYLEKFVKGNTEAEEKVAAMRAGMEEIRGEMDRKSGSNENSDEEETRERPEVESGVSIRIGGQELNLSNLVGGLIQTLGNIASEGEETTIRDLPGGKGKIETHFSVRTAGSGIPRGRVVRHREKQRPSESFGHQFQRPTPKKGQPSKVEIRKPEVDITDEGKYVLVVAQMPGVSQDSITYDINKKVLTLSTQGARHQYETKLGLPCLVDAGHATKSYQNGVFTLKLPKV